MRKFKQFLAITMALSMVFSTNAFATEINLENSSANASITDTLDKTNGTDHFADETTNNWQDGSITEEVRVNVDRASFFDITIPKEIVLNGNDGSASYEVSITGELAGDQALVVKPDATFTLTEDGGKTTPVTVTQTKDTFNYQDINNNEKGNGTLSASGISAGNWSGKFNFNIEFKDVSHTHSYTSTVTKQANCTEQGVKTYTCECGDTYTENIAIDLDNHDYDEGVVTKEATCTETGVKTYTCSRCNNTYTEPIPMKPLPTKDTFNNMSWADIATVSEAGKASEYFAVGDEKEIIIGKYSYYDSFRETTVTHPETTYHVQILGFDHDDKSDGTGKAGITVGLKEIMTTTHAMNSTKTNVGGWKDSEMRTYVNGKVYDNLSQEVKDVIKPVNKLTSEGNKSTNITTTSDKLFLLSEVEIFGSTIYSASGEGSQYQYFADGGSKIKYQTGSSAGYSWWGRSPRVGSAGDFCFVSHAGNANFNGSYSTYDVVFGFSI